MDLHHYMTKGQTNKQEKELAEAGFWSSAGRLMSARGSLSIYELLGWASKPF